MRKNFPVTSVETSLRPDQYLISKTDLKGRITYVNPAFIEISGYTRDELLGKAHNIVRHPDMPPVAFQDLWDTLRAGKPWLGMVKNRRKDGGFYWVLANAAPIFVKGEITGYASVRVKPTEEQIAQAQAFYDDVNADNSRGYTVKAGQRVRAGWRRALDVLAAPFAPTLLAGILRMAALSTATTAAATWFAVAGGLPPEFEAWILGAIAAGTVANIAYGWRIAQSIVKPLDGAARISRQIASGNLSVDINAAQEGEVGNLYFYLDMMRKSLLGISHGVHAGVDATTALARVLNESNANLSARTEDQAASLQQTAASMEELTVTVKQNAANANQASELADESVHSAQRGGEVVGDVVLTMKDLHGSSRKISEIVSLIESIAFQTNILALNAAVEAARAGEQGKGFAVVAAEVRSLAQKSSEAAKQIKTLIDESVRRMALGSEQAERAGEAMQEIVQSVQRVTNIMGEISTASIEQSSGLEQINQAITQIDDVTHRNATLVQELGQTVASITKEAEHLQMAIQAMDVSGQS